MTDEYDEEAKRDYFALKRFRTPGWLTVEAHIADLARIRRRAAGKAFREAAEMVWGIKFLGHNAELELLSSAMKIKAAELESI